MMRPRRRWAMLVTLAALAACDASPGVADRPAAPADTAGCRDRDGDGYGALCELGVDCDDNDGAIHVGCVATCARIHAGCACEPGEVADCRLMPEGAQQCSAGIRTCNEDGLFGACTGDEIEPVASGSHEYGIIVDPPIPCGNCDPACFESEDIPNGGDINAQNASGLVWDPEMCWDENGDGDTNDRGECGALKIGGSTVSARYAWIANSPDSTVSKLDLASGREVGRFYVGLPDRRCSQWADGCNLPSRTAVDGFGNAYVANRAFGGQGTVVKIAADPYYCVDRNRNGVIDTSTGSIPMDWGRDECILWTANVGGSGAAPRALAIDAGDAGAREGYVWVGTYNEQRAYRLYPRDGSRFCFQRLGNGTCVRDYVDLGMSPYGAAADRRGMIWWTQWGSSNHLIAVDAASGTVLHRASSNHPSCDSEYTYGIAVDRWGQIWTGGWDCGAFRYNIGDANRWNDESWCYIEPIRRCNNTGLACTRDRDCGGAGTCVNGAGVSRGVAADCEGNVWIAYSQDPTAVQYLRDDTSCGAGNTIPRTSTRVVEMRRPNGASSGSGGIGVGVDFEGRIWTVNNSTNNVSVFNPNLWRTNTYAVGAAPYTYSDFTGYQRQNFVNPSGWYRHTYDARLTCEIDQQPVWYSLSWDVRTPAETQITFEAYYGDSVNNLSAEPVHLATVPGDSAPVDLVDLFDLQGITNPDVLSLLVTLTSLDGTATPVLRSVYVEFLCLDSE